MENQKPVVCSENKDLTTYMWEKMREMAEQPKGISENIDTTLQKAFSNVCKSKTPIKTLKDFSQIKGVGKWIVRLMQGFFETQTGTSESSEGGLDEIEGLTKKGKKIKGRYVPKKSSGAYALLLTLYRGTVNGNDFMRKQDIIDAAEASGLSRVPIAPEKGKVKPGSFGTSPKDWYSGWSCMKTLITKGLVVKSSCPAKYMLTQEGQEAARECLLRSGLVDSGDELAAIEGGSNLCEHNTSDLEFVRVNSAEEVASHSVLLSNQKKNVDIPLKSIERNMPEYQDIRVDCLATSNTCLFTTDRLRENNRKDACGGSNMPKKSYTADCAQSSFTLRACSFWDSSGSWPFVFKPPVRKVRCLYDGDDPVKKSGSDGLEANMKSLSMPPLSFGENFEDAYDVILILDDREKFAMQGPRSWKIIENIRSQFKIRIEVRRLPVGDGIWIARHKHLDSEYVLDFIVERKKVDDLRCSIRDNRYRDQKLRLVRCGLKKLIYLVEGDLNSSEAADSIKTACFTTEILEGFDVQRTSGLGATLRKYGYLTQGITHYYRSQLPDDKVKSTGVCPTFVEFIKRCQDLDKMTVGDVFAIQLMQVPQVTEEIAIAILDMYPTLFSLARAYTLLDGDVCAQEEMLQKQSNNVVGASASRNIFQLVWGN